MFSRLRQFLRSLLEDDWAGAWQAPERKLARTDDAAAQKAQPGRNTAAAPDAEDGAEAGKGAKAEDRG